MRQSDVKSGPSLDKIGVRVQLRTLKCSKGLIIYRLMYDLEMFIIENGAV